MKKSREYLSMPIISVSEGQQIGSVRGLVVNPTAMEVAALLVDQKGFFKEQRVIPYTKVKSVGDNAITIARINNAEKVTSLPEIVSMLKDKVSLLNTKVITETGKVLGIVEEFYLDPASGAIVAVEIASNFLTGWFKGRARLERQDLVTMGKDVIIAASGTEERLSVVETGVSETLKTVKDSTTNLWYSSVQRTKELSKHLTKGKEQIEDSPQQVARLSEETPEQSADHQHAEPTPKPQAKTEPTTNDIP